MPYKTKAMSVRKRQIRRIAVAGLGKLGACIAATFAHRGFEVIGLEIDQAKVKAVNRRQAPVDEPMLPEIIAQAGSRLRATTQVSEAVEQSDATFFVPPTPSQPEGSFSNEYLLQALRSVAEAARARAKQRYVFVVNSTVTPGSCDAVFKPLLEDILQGRCGQDFGLCYNPEFIALGNVIRGLLEPDFVLIGESDPLSGALLEEVYKRFCLNAPPIERMSNLNAELAKICVNCAVTMKISFVNQLSAVCAKIPGADPGVILKAIGKDHRIGPDYLKPGLGYGGPCFPRDNRLFQYTARSVGVEASLAEATDKINEAVNSRLLQTVLTHSPGGPVAVLGLAYKPFTNVIDCSPGIWLCQQLAERGCQVYAHDYAAIDSAATVLTNGRIRLVSDASELLHRPELRTFVLSTPWFSYRELFHSNLQAFEPGTVVIDPWSLLADLTAEHKNISHITLSS